MANPFRGFTDMLSEMSRRREDWMQGGGVSQQERGTADAWVPEADVLAEEGNMVILVDLPGVSRDDIDLELSGETLTISGEKPGRGGDRAAHYTRERRFGYFRRSMSLLAGIDPERISSSFGNGVLEITVGDYAAVPEPQQIEVSGRSG